MLEPNGGLCVECLLSLPISSRASFFALRIHPNPEEIMVVTVAELSPIVALVAGILILIVPRLLNIIVAVYLIVEGLIGLNDIHHFFR
jgi:hypothetical protein